jgi:UDPglucose--hexose-1-phosphate uridylyltransferase
MLEFKQEAFNSTIVLPDGNAVQRPIEIRTNPITGRTCRITYSRSEESEPGGSALPEPPPFARDKHNCPFCPERLATHTPLLSPELCPQGRMVHGSSTLFPNLFPYGRYSAVSLFDDDHFVEIGKARLQSYVDSLLNCRNYLLRVRSYDPAAVFMAITQNHLPSAGGSLLHPHLQLQADRTPSNNFRFLQARAAEYRQRTGRLLFSDYLDFELRDGRRCIGSTGCWQWLAAYAPESFFELWGILPGVVSLSETTEDHWTGLAQGVLCCQKFYRNLGRNGYNFGLLLLEDGSRTLELRATLTVRSNYAPWVRSDFTGFELALGDMATFTAPESTATKARSFWPGNA